LAFIACLLWGELSNPGTQIIGFTKKEIKPSLTVNYYHNRE